MPIVFASAGSHAPGMTAWAEAAPADQKQRLYKPMRTCRARCTAAGPTWSFC